jgi:hypothetical protein
MKKQLVYFLLFGLCACDLVVDVDIPLSPNQLTINSLFGPDSTWLVMLTNNRHILNDSSFQGVEDAVVMIVEDGAVADTLVHETNGIYRSHARPTVGKEYQLIARTGTSEITTGHSTILKPEVVTKVELIKGVATGHGRLNNKINVTFADKSPELNYYQIIVKTVYEQIDFQQYEKVLSFPVFVRLESDDPAIQNQIINQYEGVVIKDVLFNGKEVTLSFKTPENDLFQEGAVVVSLRTLSPEYYRYKTTAALQEHTSGDPFAQPVNVYSNVKNGYGIFAGFSQSEYYKEIYPRPAITGITPSKGKPGDHIIISGINFTDTGYGVTFRNDGSGERVEVVHISATEIEVIVPKGAITGKIAFYNHGRVVLSPEAFEVIP